MWWWSCGAVRCLRRLKWSTGTLDPLRHGTTIGPEGNGITWLRALIIWIPVSGSVRDGIMLGHYCGVAATVKQMSLAPQPLAVRVDKTA
jgi:hypothetical protein